MPGPIQQAQARVPFQVALQRMDPVRPTMQRVATQVTYTGYRATVSSTLAAGAGAIQGGYIPYAGRLLDSVWITVTGSSTPVMTLQPFIYRASGALKETGRSVSTSGKVLVVGVPFRCHVETGLGLQLPAGSLLALAITRTSGSMTDVVVHWVTYGGSGG